MGKLCARCANTNPYWKGKGPERICYTCLCEEQKADVEQERDRYKKALKLVVAKLEFTGATHGRIALKIALEALKESGDE